jgi:hypothetical protein
MLAFCLNALGNVATAQHDYAAARDHYLQALATSADNNETPLVLEILVGIARLLGMHEGWPEKARELATLVLENPASDQATRDSAEKLLTELELLLPGAQSDRKPQLPLDAAVASILHGETIFTPEQSAR